MTPDSTLRAFALIFALLGIASMVVQMRYGCGRCSGTGYIVR